MEISLARTDLAEVFLLKHGREPLNVVPRESLCTFRGVHFLEEHPFILGFESREWLVEKGSAFLTEPGRLHHYSHVQGMPADTVMSVRFRQPLVDCMQAELADVPFARLDSFIGLRNELRFLRWRWSRLPDCRQPLHAGRESLQARVGTASGRWFERLTATSPDASPGAAPC